MFKRRDWRLYEPLGYLSRLLVLLLFFWGDIPKDFFIGCYICSLRPRHGFGDVFPHSLGIWAREVLWFRYGSMPILPCRLLNVWLHSKAFLMVFPPRGDFFCWCGQWCTATWTAEEFGVMVLSVCSLWELLVRATLNSLLRGVFLDLFVRASSMKIAAPDKEPRVLPMNSFLERHSREGR